MKELKSGYQRIMRKKVMKSIPIWFPNPDQQIEVRNCKECTKMTKNLTGALYITEIDLPNQ